jgi:ubiquinol-cytochrome c reductase cytochrome c1 subunit
MRLANINKVNWIKNMKKIFIILMLLSGSAFANSDVEHPKQLQWPFDGAFGTVDRQAAQRGFQVYKEVCASCHALKRNSYRDLMALGFSEEEVKAIAAEATVKDGPNDAGDMFDRPARISDKFAAPFANDNAARASNGGALPPDLSLIIKARPDGANYVHSLLTGYAEAPADFKLGEGMNYNPYFPGHQIAMAPPLSDGRVTYQDGTEATAEQMSRDVVTFLQWAAEPEMEARKHMGIKVFGYLIVFTVLFYLAKKRIWKNVK